VILVLLIALGTASAGWNLHREWCQRDKVYGSGNLATVIRDVKSFTRIEVDCAFDVEITVGPEREVKLTFDDNLLDLITTRVRGRTLYLDCDGEHSSDYTCLAEITVPQLEELTIDGAGNALIRGFSGEYLEYNLRGAGDLVVEGAVGELEINLSGAGDVDTRQLVAKHSDVSVSGAGHVKVYAEKSFRGVVSGVGTIAYYGNPERVRKSVPGIGRIRRR
jgi:hypothetical protein